MIFIQIAILAFAFSVTKSVRVRALISVFVSSKLVITVVAHILGVMLTVWVGTVPYFHFLSFSKPIVGFGLIL